MKGPSCRQLEAMPVTRREFLQGVVAGAVGGLCGCVGDELDRSGSDQGPFDICVIGSGFAGTYLALRTVSRGLTTVIVEAGLTVGSSGRPDLRSAFQWANSGEIAYPIDAMRMIAVGGTSGHWTGRVNRLRPPDFRMRCEFGMSVDWPIGYDDLDPYYCEAEQALSTTGYAPVPGAEPPRSCDYPYEPKGLYRSPAVSFEGKALKFFSVPKSRIGGRRGPVRLARSEIPQFLKYPGSNFLSDSQVTNIVTLDGKTIDHVVVRTAAGAEERVRAKCFVVAAGALEIPRLLLRSCSHWFPEGLGNNHDLVGRFFIEHPTFMWSFEARDCSGLYEGIHRTYSLNDRFRAQRLNACQYQIRVLPSNRVVWKLQPELESRGENRVTLSTSKRDSFGNPVPDLHFSTSELDRKTVDKGMRFLEQQAQYFSARTSKIDKIRKWRAHPAGTCRMGFDERSGVVDRDNRVFGLDNLYVSGAAVFPTAGTSNPTLSVVAMTLRLADHLLARFGREGRA